MMSNGNTDPFSFMLPLPPSLSLFSSWTYICSSIFPFYQCAGQLFQIHAIKRRTTKICFRIRHGQNAPFAVLRFVGNIIFQQSPCIINSTYPMVNARERARARSWSQARIKDQSKPQTRWDICKVQYRWNLLGRYDDKSRAETNKNQYARSGLHRQMAGAISKQHRCADIRNSQEYGQYKTQFEK